MGDPTGGGGVPCGEGDLPLGGLLLPPGSAMSCACPLRAAPQRTQDSHQPRGPQVGGQCREEMERLLKGWE